ncbi:MAG: hypothetical protein QXQ70_02055 [Candidatus Caldarchaeum sp.]
MAQGSLIKIVIPVVVAVIAVGLGITFIISQPGGSPTQTTTTTIFTTQSPTLTLTTTQTTPIQTTPQTTITTIQTTPQTTVQTTTTPSLQVNLRSFFQTYIEDISKRDVPAVVSKYTSSSVAVWGGKAAGLGGTYRGEGNIRILYIAALGTAKTIQFKEISYNEKVEGNMGVIESEQAISGNSDILGAFNGTVKIELKIGVVNNKPVILEENWDYLSFNYEKTGGATTFPQWADIKAGRPIALEPDKSFKDLAWFLSDYFALAVYAALATLSVMAVIGLRKNNR